MNTILFFCSILFLAQPGNSGTEQGMRNNGNPSPLNEGNSPSIVLPMDDNTAYGLSQAIPTTIQINITGNAYVAVKQTLAPQADYASVSELLWECTIFSCC